MTPDGHIRVFAFDAAVESTGMIVTRPETCSGSSSWISRSAATWPSYSSPWFPARTSTFGPSPFAIEAIGMKVLAQPPVFVIFGSCSRPICFPEAERSIVQETGWSRHARAASAAATAVSVASSRRSTSSSVCAYEKWLRFRFSGSSKIPWRINSRR